MNTSEDSKWLRRITLSVVLGMFIFSVVTPFVTGQLRISDVVNYYLVKLDIVTTSSDKRNLEDECAKLVNVSTGQTNANTPDPVSYKPPLQESLSDHPINSAEREKYGPTSPLLILKDGDNINIRPLVEAELVNSSIDIKNSQPFAIMAHGTILIDRTERGASRPGYRDITPVVCVNGVNHHVFKTPELRWDSGYYVREFYKKREFAEQLTPVFLGECPIKMASRYEPDILQIEETVEQSLGRAFQATSDERAKCDTRKLLNKTSDRHVKSIITGAGNQAVLSICNTLTICTDTSKYAVEELWLFTGDEPARLVSNRVHSPFGEVFNGNDADCTPIGESTDLDGDGNMELYIYERGAESWSLGILEYEAGEFIIRAAANDGL